MTICDVYLGDLEDPKFKWDGGDWNGNQPTSVVDSFPGTLSAYNAKFHAWLATMPDIESKQTDYGAYVAKVTKNQVLDYLSYVYSPDFLKRFPVDAEAMKKARKQTKGLPDKLYGLVATEF